MLRPTGRSPQGFTERIKHAAGGWLHLLYGKAGDFLQSLHLVSGSRKLTVSAAARKRLQARLERELSWAAAAAEGTAATGPGDPLRACRTPGAPGAPGSPGAPGAPGAPGGFGMPGAGGFPGAAGAPGAPGSGGFPGFPGFPGWPGGGHGAAGAGSGGGPGPADPGEDDPGTGGPENPGSPAPGSSRPLTPEQAERLLRRIRRETAEGNRSNVTRTAAYWTFYRQHPELHWAFLAHMVSRNGGWNMTDLKGDFLPRLIGGAQRERIFEMLEAANALIFGDAYPQLLLYQESLKRGTNLSGYLRDLGVSLFMKAVWDDFWENRDPIVLTIGLIVNEQNYIQGRVVEDPHYRKHVLETPAFQAQAVLQLNQVLFPYRSSGPDGDSTGAAAAPQADGLVGLILEDFMDLDERISFGTKLYAILFGLAGAGEDVRRFAAGIPHTGSRSDYWPQVFAPHRKTPPVRFPKERLEGCGVVKGSERLYSPALADAWPDRPVTDPAVHDWCGGTSMLRYFRSIQAPFPVEITHEQCLALKKLELAALAGKLISP
ncbi:DUF2515 family protein [Paenibacillus aurantius]|uniref:DUF2515 family protein n=1 Tax=Paenibacillus aurantius TaxID=2918900 RepID=A0AA96LG15_9BACL|nr:DUF2515 family protein [Paenibacillus aurantius]WNQ12623.1 DUF2515 family protein [Paenibacillus aurantius]